MVYKIRFGTNIDYDNRYEQARSLLIRLFDKVAIGEPEYTRDYEAEPDDENADIYLNFYATVESDLSPLQIKELMRNAEKEMGRTFERKKRGIIDADFDICDY
ncbi:MAG: 2-amino-4-hydroxy-6-hydroxymethyldihydropteridine diphosphokinase [Bacteroidaceae bacterium]|nr:2-amino-4-hydroxy-6-hydroxymethyldihydropteridine diphosphokinase [Bacteroidaceae bacterium]